MVFVQTTIKLVWPAALGTDVAEVHLSFCFFAGASAKRHIFCSGLSFILFEKKLFFLKSDLAQ